MDNIVFYDYVVVKQFLTYLIWFLIIWVDVKCLILNYPNNVMIDSQVIVNISRKEKLLYCLQRDSLGSFNLCMLKVFLTSRICGMWSGLSIHFINWSLLSLHCSSCFTFDILSKSFLNMLLLLLDLKSCDDILEPTLDEFLKLLKDFGGLLDKWLSDHITERLSLLSSPDDLFNFFSELRGKQLFSL